MRGGYSILAALVFVAILGGVAVFFDIAASYGNPVAMSAAAANPSATETKKLTDPETEKKCNEAIKKAQSNAGKSPMVNHQFKGDTFEPNKCVGALADASKISSVMARDKISQAEALLKDDSYTCWGESTKVYMNKKGEGTITSQVKEGVEKGMCETQFCDESGVNCSSSKLKDGKESIMKQLTSDKDLLKQLTPSQLEGVKNLGEMSPAQQQVLKDVFAEQKIETENQIKKNETRLAEVNQALENCAWGGCDEAQNAANAKALAAEKAQLEAKNNELKQRMEALAQGERSDLKPATPNSQFDGWGTPCSDAKADRATCGTYAPKPAVVNPPIPPRDPRKPSTFADPSGSPQPSSGGGNPLSALGSLLQNFAKGLAGSGALSPKGPACPSDPNAYQQQQQQYQMQMQQYNQQLQQYNYQQQQIYNYGGTLPTPPTPPVACTPTDTSNTCPAAPAQPAVSGCLSGSWRPVTTKLSNGHQCTSSWQCVPSNVTPPTAELSCQPKVADVGMTIAISFACSGATGSTGGGFSTQDATSGSTTTVIATPPAGATTITYGVTCRNQSLTARAECSVQIAKPTIVLLVNPKVVPSGEASTVGWITSGMQACTVSSPQMPGFTTQNASKKNVNGVATTSPITRETQVVLTCDTLGGGTRVASTTIYLEGSVPVTAMSATSTLDGRTNVTHGSSATIHWNTPSAPTNSAVALWLVDMLSGQSTALIEGGLAKTGSFTWSLPATSTPCAADSPYVCGADLVVGRSYSIQAALYTPANAFLGGFPPANPVSPTYLEDIFTTPFKMTN